MAKKSLPDEPNKAWIQKRIKQARRDALLVRQKEVSVPDLARCGREIARYGKKHWLLGALIDAFFKARKGKLKTFNEHAYEVNWYENLDKLADVILSWIYKPSGSISFVIYDPMIREIFAAPFVDRIIHHFLYEMQAGWWDRRFIYDSYSCRNGRGTLFGVERVQKMIRSATKGMTEKAYIIKLDVKGYFMSLPREKLFEKVEWGLHKQFGEVDMTAELRWLLEVCLFLWRQVLMDDPVPKSHKRGNRRNWDDLPPEKSLYTRDPGLGIVIGNLTSQLVSNIYLDALDRFVKYELGYKYYGRYVDDFIIIVPEKDYARALRDVKRIEQFLKVELNLTLHKKKRFIQPADKGVNFLGAKIYPFCIYPSSRLQAKFKRELYGYIYRGWNNEDTLTSYMGIMKNMDAENFVKDIFEKNGLDFALYLESKSAKRRKYDEILQDLKKTRKKQRCIR
ncbi:hypothetical protein IKE99_00715 [Candidatus Saccharibacteria bacterium]|nr:hypothetical protein [Candidatus Saccharibacteria bacterium]